MKVALLLALAASSALADIYMQNMRGSNDRLNEANTNRNNANRLFDSQNNAKGGYCYTLGTPPMSFYEGSMLPIEWTAQHGCGNPKLQCNMVVQYMCGSNQEADQTVQIRDGTTTNTITNDANFNQKDGNGQYVYGMHESQAYYQSCTTRQRNMGLFVADRIKNQNTLRGTTAQFTRQNNNGDRHGFECPEERDYYPYWHPSPWRDIAILVDDQSHCGYFQGESQNVKSKNQCVDSTTGKPTLPNNEQACNAAGNTWQTVSSFGIKAPDCVVSPWSRDNHLGNAAGIGAETVSYNWTLPVSADLACIGNGDCTCVLRIRYNISTNDIDGYGWDGKFDDWTTSGLATPVKNDPTVPVQGGQLTLALDTTQVGRTFQDRSHTFSIKARPSNVPQYARIFNLNVRGKRGNIVQTYPATEYDFTPTQLTTRQNDYIHFQWTGCDNNPAGNAGEGTDQTDRSNIVQIDDLADNYPVNDTWYTSGNSLFDSYDLRTRMAHLDQPINDPTKCLNYTALIAAGANVETDVRNCAKLNAAAPYFDGGLIQMNKTGTFNYMSSRNNNFSNRGQKATIQVIPILPVWAIAVVSVGAGLFVTSGGAAAAMFYANSHPHTAAGSAIQNFLAKMKF